MTEPDRTADAGPHPALAYVVDAYLPPVLWERLPPTERGWRGRVILVLWAAGYRLEHAYSLAMTDDPGHVADFRHLVDRVDDAVLAASFDAQGLGRTSPLGFWFAGGPPARPVGEAALRRSRRR